MALWGLSQQAKFGNCKDEKPSKIWIKDLYKWKAWSKMEGTPQEKARREFIEYTESMLAYKFCDDPKIKAEGKKEVEKMERRFDPYKMPKEE